MKLMKITALVLALLMMTAVPAAAGDLFVPHVSSLRINKFELQLVGNNYWFVQKGEWDWEKHPLTLCCSFGEENSEKMILESGKAGHAQILCSKDTLQEWADPKGEHMRWTLTYTEDGKEIELDADMPLLENVWATIGLLYRIWYADGALWYAGGNASVASPSGLTKTFSDGRTETVPLPALNGSEAHMVLSPSEIERDLADPNTGWVVYSLSSLS